ncbi:MAG: glucosylceramidase, partial [Tannerella sp.]|nr:glucosylceramidase [Tannerella sp.]
MCIFAGLMLIACGDANRNKTNDDEKEIDGDVTLYVTTGNRSFDFRKQTVKFSEKSNMSPITITLDPETRYQSMDGFGAAITGSTCYNLLKMSSENRTKFLKETFSPTEGMGYSYIRISIGCSDFSLSEYTCCDSPG